VSKNHAIMNLSKIPIHWFDFAVVIIIMLGVRNGRKNGLSVELMVTMQWVAIVLGGAYLYRPVGNFICQTSPVSHQFGYLCAYITLAILIKLSFALVKKGLGGKLIGSNVFGRGEYYLGMVAGALRFVCIIIAALALLSAPYYSAQDLAKNKAYQVDLYGSTFFPNLGTLQHGVFKESILGSAMDHYAGFLLISPTKPENRGIQRRKDDLP